MTNYQISKNQDRRAKLSKTLGLFLDLDYQETLVNIAYLYKRGFKAEYIGSIYEITRQRVYQVVEEVKQKGLKIPKTISKGHLEVTVCMRDNWTCQICLKKQSEPKIHYFEPIKSYSIKSLEKMIVVCDKCNKGKEK